MVVAKVAPYSRTVVQDLRSDSEHCNALGLLGVTAYYCWNYTAPLHRDSDHGWSISVQTQKTSRQDEYNFAYADWGHYLETCTNCVWYVQVCQHLRPSLLIIMFFRWFKGTDTHGTIMPRLSSLTNGISNGFAFTVPQKSYSKGL